MSGDNLHAAKAAAAGIEGRRLSRPVAGRPAHPSTMWSPRPRTEDHEDVADILEQLAAAALRQAVDAESARTADM
ncbi:hypothetical protein CLM62_37090 [Streptomyces sp. SA15]|uniref:hypothetical protein n=1 Tax=Streptomyces sp. SA15 TaxID=934019 RepID=UPI000BAEBE5A|nr:hypothetical protein [Streptomyces sp. SA15]PAZ11172.1 hypothetical protein CLM62_37090 [Streptomyces sp. SA15]